MSDKKGNGQLGVDLIARLYTETMELGSAFDRLHAENVRHHEENLRHHAEQKRLHEEMRSTVRQMAEMSLAIADRLNDHERRLAAVEAKVG